MINLAIRFVRFVREAMAARDGGSSAAASRILPSSVVIPRFQPALRTMRRADANGPAI
jgi:hypothetical protein